MCVCVCVCVYVCVCVIKIYILLLNSNKTTSQLRYLCRKIRLAKAIAAVDKLLITRKSDHWSPSGTIVWLHY